jgi:hypothetical protein
LTYAGGTTGFRAFEQEEIGEEDPTLKAALRVLEGRK